MTKPNYAVLKDNSLVGTYDSLVEALAAGGQVYERYGNGLRKSADHQAKLLKSLKWAMGHMLNVTLLAESEDEEMYAEARATIEAVEKYEREVAKAIGEEVE